ncbi:5'/3'-nucleotidase SurE [candidate division KSB1 bacterium RBG_16_48_16]|nr:MAG: 5'/3'-nucleotidase SurE [candidate division KSB1 bacterium RBG_16_48_16]
MKILLTNDDGINAPGLAALAKAVAKIGEVTIVAPATEMSAVGHAITLSDPLRVANFTKNDHFFGYAVNGTPADCVKIAYWALLKNKPKPDLLISGINLGSNTGINTIYSGTVSAATEGAIIGLPSFAISLATFTDPNFAAAAEFAVKLAEIVCRKPLPAGVFLNVNVPNVPKDEINGVRITRQGRARYIEEFQPRKDPHQRKYYWLTGEKVKVETDPDVDDRAILENYIAITPIHYDLTCYSVIESLRGWQIEI